MQKRAVSRRDFIKGGIAASAAIGLPTIVPSTVLGAEAPSGRVNVGQIGCGVISNYHTNSLIRMKDVRIVGVCDAYKSRRERKAAVVNKHYGNTVAKVHTDFREMLAAESVMFGFCLWTMVPGTR